MLTTGLDFVVFVDLRFGGAFGFPFAVLVEPVRASVSCFSAAFLTAVFEVSAMAKPL